MAAPMSELVCNVNCRSMSETIVAAVSTFGLFVAANWGTASLLDDDSLPFTLPQFLRSIEYKGILTQILAHTMFSFALPFLSYALSLENANKVSGVKRGLVKRGGEVKSVVHGSIAIIAVCPVYIRFPASALASTHEQHSLEGRGYESVSLKDIEDLCPLELRPYCPAPAAAVNAINRIEDEEDSTQWMCYKVPMYKFGKSSRERALLLALGLTPTNKQLGFLPSRSRFQNIVTGLQAVGYMLTLIQRVAHHLAISPLEAFVTFLCIITSIQLLLELYACGHYQCPLLLRLNTDQFCRLRDEKPPTNEEDYASNLEGVTFFSQLIFSWLLLLGVSMYYFVHYVHTYLICSLSALLFFLAHCTLPLLAVFLVQKYLGWFVLVLYYGLYASSMILAVVSTIVDWKAFQEANQKPWYSWILPHLSS